nr:MAG TPA: bifunctional HTH-domain containing protein/aminotransferase [Caudoviricetes sp.]
MNIIVDSFVHRFNAALAERNIRPIELAEKTKLSRSTISHYMNGYAQPKSDKLFILSKALNVNEQWLMGYDVPMEQNDCEDTTIAKRDAALADIEKILQAKKYSLCCESYDDNFFTIKNAFGQTIAGLYDYELLPRYEALKQNGNVTIDLLISSEAAFFRYMESIGYYIAKDTSGSDSRIEYSNKYGNGFIKITPDTLTDIKSRIDTYAKATIDSIICKEYEEVFRKKRENNESLTTQLLAAAHDRTDINVTEEMKKHDDDIMNDDSEWE